MCQLSVRIAALHRDEIDEAYYPGRLARKMAAKIRLVRRRHRVARHDRMTIQAIDSPTHRSKQISRCLIATHAGIGDDHGRPTAEPMRCNFDGAADRANVWRRVECRAHLVMDDRRAGCT